MQKLFNKILVPVDFSSGSRQLLEKATDTAIQYSCSIHLLHVVPLDIAPQFAFGLSDTITPNDIIDNKKELDLQMEKLCSLIPVLKKNGPQPDYSIVKGSWDEVIIEMINQYKYDLVLIGQKSRLMPGRKMQINPDKIAEKTSVPVITIPLNRRLTKLYSIVIPITDFLPLRKLIYGIYLADSYNSTIKLLGVENKKTRDRVKYYLKKAYYLIHDNCNVPVEIELVVGTNVAEAVNEFANLHAADLIIVNPGTQTRMRGFFSRLFGNILQKYSAPPVLTINPS